MPELFPRLSHEDLAKFLSFQTSFSPSLAISNALFASSGGPEPRPRLHLHVAGVGERERQERAGDYHCRQALEDPEPYPRLRSAGRSPRLRSRSDRSVTWLPSLVSCFSPAATPRESMCCIFCLEKILLLAVWFECYAVLVKVQCVANSWSVTGNSGGPWWGCGGHEVTCVSGAGFGAIKLPAWDEWTKVISRPAPSSMDR